VKQTDPTIDLNDWLQQIESIEQQSSTQTPPTREAYFGLLAELGYTDVAISKIEDHSNDLVVKAHGHLDAGTIELGLLLLEEAVRLTPWRTELNTIMAVSYTDLFKRDGRIPDGERARALLTRCIDLMPEVTAHYTTLKEVEQTFKRRQRRQRVIIVNLAGLVLCASLALMWNGIPLSDKPLITNAVDTVEQPIVEPKVSQPLLVKPPLKVPMGNLAVKQNPSVSIVHQVEPGIYGLPVTANHTQGIDGLVINAEESSISIRPYLERRHGKLKLRLLNQGSKNIVALSALVEWVSVDHRVLSAKQAKLVPSKIGLFVGESRAAYLSDFDLSPETAYAKITVTNLVFGSENAKRAKPSPACTTFASDIPTSSSLTVHAYPVQRHSFVTSALFSVKNEASDLTQLYAYPSFYNSQGQLLTTASRRTILSRQIISSNLMPVLKSGEMRFFEITSILSPKDRMAVSKVCVEFTTDSSLP
jgi:hypothetical protein